MTTLLQKMKNFKKMECKKPESRNTSRKCEKYKKYIEKTVKQKILSKCIAFNKKKHYNDDIGEFIIELNIYFFSKLSKKLK